MTADTNYESALVTAAIEVCCEGRGIAFTEKTSLEDLGLSNADFAEIMRHICAFLKVEPTGRTLEEFVAQEFDISMLINYAVLHSKLGESNSTPTLLS